MKWSDDPLQNLAIGNSTYHEGPPFWGSQRGSTIIPFERTMLISYRLSIVTIALSLTIQPQFAIEYLRRSNQQGGSLWVEILWCSPWSTSVCRDLQRANTPG